MTDVINSPSITPETDYPLFISVETLHPQVEDVLGYTDPFPEWPLGKVALEEKSAAICIGVKPQILRGATFQLKLCQSAINRGPILGSIILAPCQFSRSGMESSSYMHTWIRLYTKNQKVIHLVILDEESKTQEEETTHES